MGRFKTAAALLAAHFVLVTGGVAAAMWALHGTAAGGLYGGIVALWTLPLTLFAVLFLRPRFSRPRFGKGRWLRRFRFRRPLKTEHFREPPRPPVSRQSDGARRPPRSARYQKSSVIAPEPSPAACAGREQSLS